MWIRQIVSHVFQFRGWRWSTKDRPIQDPYHHELAEAIKFYEGEEIC